MSCAISPIAMAHQWRRQVCAITIGALGKTNGAKRAPLGFFQWSANGATALSRGLAGRNSWSRFAAGRRTALIDVARCPLLPGRPIFHAMIAGRPSAVSGAIALPTAPCRAAPPYATADRHTCQSQRACGRGPPSAWLRLTPSRTVRWRRAPGAPARRRLLGEMVGRAGRDQRHAEAYDPANLFSPQAGIPSRPRSSQCLDTRMDRSVAGSVSPQSPRSKTRARQLVN
jgi:hypothetical protein